MSLKIDLISVLQRATSEIISYRQQLSDLPIPPQINALEARRRFGGPLNDIGQSPIDVIDSIVSEGKAGLFQMASSRFFGYVIGASHPVGVAADILCSGWGQATGNAEETTTTVAMENAVCDWTINLLGLPPNCGVGIVTGATMGNTVGIMAARNALMKSVNWDVEARGLFDAPEIHVVIGAEAHSATSAALRYAGLGSERVHRIPVDNQGRISPHLFKETIKTLSGPILVILQAGHINSGAFDHFDKLIPIAHKKQAWVHVDGAFGLWVNAVPQLANRLSGVSEADSWAVDLHKWLNAPYDAGMVITRDRGPLVSAMSAKDLYLPDISKVWDPNDSTPELSRRARGVPSYAIMRTLGRQGIVEMIAKHCRLAEWVSMELSTIPELTVLNEVACNQVSFYCGEGDNRDKMTRAVLEVVQKEGKVYPSHGSWRGGQIIRVSVIGFETSECDVEQLVESIRQAVDYVMLSKDIV